MSSYLISTALMTVLTESSVIAIPMETSISTNVTTTSQLNEGVNLNATSKSFANGDFSSLTRSINTESLYTGDGSRELSSVRIVLF